jgi:Ca2+-binding RTX toxin-like protein
LNGGAGNDLLIGGNGKDTFILGSGQGLDTIQDFNTGPGQKDSIQGLAFDSLELISSAGGTLMKVAGTGEEVALLLGVDPTSLDASFFS